MPIKVSHPVREMAVRLFGCSKIMEVIDRVPSAMALLRQLRVSQFHLGTKLGAQPSHSTPEVFRWLLACYSRQVLVTKALVSFGCAEPLENFPGDGIHAINAEFTTVSAIAGIPDENGKQNLLRSI